MASIRDFDSARYGDSLKSYEFCVRGRSEEVLLDIFEELSISSGPDGVLLTGRLPDQAALYGILSTIDDLGLELVWFKELE